MSTQPSTVNLSDIENEQGGGFVINGADAYDYSGSSFSIAGDVNGDGFDDVIIGARYADPLGANENAGSAYVVYGNSSTTTFDLSNLEYGSSNYGFSIHGASSYDRLGHVSAAGDVNGDGFDDLIVGAPFAESHFQDRAGQAYVIYGSDSRTTDIDVSDLIDQNLGME